MTSTPAASAGFRLPSTIVAETSCPGIHGNDTSGLRPRKEFKSLPQKPTMRTFNRRWFGATTGSGTVAISARPGALSTSALNSGSFPRLRSPYLLRLDR